MAVGLLATPGSVVVVPSAGVVGLRPELLLLRH
jgi:hypothetical protein